MEKEIDQEILAQFVDYDGKPEHYTGSKQYWENIFKVEMNRNPSLHKKFCELHEKIVNMVISFCKDNNVECDNFSIGADGLLPSIHFNEWVPETDSAFDIRISREDDKPFLFSA